MRKFFLFVFTFTSLTWMASANAETMIGPFHVSTGKDCRIFDEWVNDDKSTGLLGMGYIDKGKSATLVFGDSSWRLKKDEELRIFLKVDDIWRDVFLATAPKRDRAVAFLLPISSEALNALMNGNELSMDIEGKGEDYSYIYTLDDDFTAAISALDSCRFETESLDEPNSKDVKKSMDKAVISSSVLSLFEAGRSPQTMFDQQTPIIHLTSYVSELNKSAEVRIDWIAEKTKMAPANYKIDSTTFNLKPPADTINGSLTKPTNGWPVGEYRVDVFIDNTLSVSLKFQID
jgi:hypothetical protein